jgi:hypothetical protein
MGRSFATIIVAAITAMIIILLLLIALVIYFVSRRRRSAGAIAGGPGRCSLSLSKEDGASQLFLMLATLFLAVTIYSFNRSMGSPVSWWTIFFLSTALGFASAYSFKTPYTLALSLLALPVWWGMRTYEWGHGKDLKPSMIFAGVALFTLLYYALGHVHGRSPKAKRFALMYLIFGIVPMTGVLFFLSTKPGIEALEEMTKGPSCGPWQVGGSLYVLLAALAASTVYSLSVESIFRTETLAIVLLAVLFLAIAFLPEQELVSGHVLSATGVVWATLLNITVFLELLGLIFSGYLRREKWLINLGALFLFLLIIVKYLDWFFTFLDKSIFFIGAGILLFAVGWFMERGRRYMISGVRGAVERTS